MKLQACNHRYNLALRSVASRNNPVMMLSQTSSYDWEDIQDKYWTVKTTGLRAYKLPSFTHGLAGIYQGGDSIKVQFGIIVNGVLWVAYHSLSSNTFDYIPLTGSPGNTLTVPTATVLNSFYLPAGILTHEQKIVNQNQNNSSPIQDIINSIKSVGGLVVLGVIVAAALRK